MAEIGPPTAFPKFHGGRAGAGKASERLKYGDIVLFSDGGLVYVHSARGPGRAASPVRRLEFSRGAPVQCECER